VACLGPIQAVGHLDHLGFELAGLAECVHCGNPRRQGRGQVGAQAQHGHQGGAQQRAKPCGGAEQVAEIVKRSVEFRPHFLGRIQAFEEEITQGVEHFIGNGVKLFDPSHTVKPISQANLFAVELDDRPFQG